MIKISREESKLLAKMGVPYGENGISHTHSHNKKYFVAETKRNLALLNKLRNKSIIKTVE